MNLSTKDDLASALGHIDMAISKLEMRIATIEQPTRKDIMFRSLKSDLARLHAELAHLIMERKETQED